MLTRLSLIISLVLWNVSPAERDSSPLVDLYHCGLSTCETDPQNNCQLAAYGLPTNGSCFATGGAYAYTCVSNSLGTYDVRGYYGACGGTALWGQASGMVPDGRCHAVQGGRGGGAYLLPHVVPALKTVVEVTAATTIDLYSCGLPDCSTNNQNQCSVVIASLPLNGSCTWNNGAYCFVATLNGDGSVNAQGLRWGGSCSCGGSPSWGTVSGLAVDGIKGCQAVQGGYGGGAYALWSGRRV